MNAAVDWGKGEGGKAGQGGRECVSEGQTGATYPQAARQTDRQRAGVTGSQAGR